MTNANDVRRAHDLLDELDARAELSQEQEKLLRSFLPELPKQKTLAGIIAHVDDAWSVASGNDWGGNSYDPDVSIEDWLTELHEQLQGLKDAPAAVPALPTGMRIAVHAVYGRVVVSPVVDDDGTCKIFHLSTHARDGSDYCWALVDSLTFIDYEPAKPTHPEFLETEADYQKAPEGTVVARDGLNPWVKEESVWMQGTTADATVYRVPCLKGTRRVLRWGK